MTQRLNQVLAVERNVKTRVRTELTDLHKASQKSELFDGLNRQYTPKDENGEAQPPERKLVQKTASDFIKQARDLLTELTDVIATKDAANQQAKADLVVDGVALLRGVPATTLLFLEKELVDINTFVEKLPTLDPAQNWHRDEALGLWVSDPVETSRTKKVQKSLVLYQATDKHPAQAQMITEDEVVGSYRLVRQSGAIRVQDKTEILERVRKLQKAVKFAREEANTVTADPKSFGDSIFGFLFNGK